MEGYHYAKKLVQEWEEDGTLETVFGVKEQKFDLKGRRASI
jgi:hypothetical protein